MKTKTSKNPYQMVIDKAIKTGMPPSNVDKSKNNKQKGKGC